MVSLMPPHGNLSREHILLERRGVTLDTALRLARYFGGDAQSWLNLQNAYDLKVAENELLPKISKEVLPRAA